MPTYQYKREDGSVFEITQKISEEALGTCPETGQKVKRVITGGSGVVYKGTGWYVTDYKNKSNGSNGNADTGSNGSSNETKTAHKETGDGAAGTAASSASSKSSAGKSD